MEAERRKGGAGGDGDRGGGRRYECVLVVSYFRCVVNGEMRVGFVLCEG